ncbi:MAG: hypothetical protein IBJ11_11785, partial [Phycisphaerales bacterium]|nr:hypothetical protein [Phycisphaerales bacterium]
MWWAVALPPSMAVNSEMPVRRAVPVTAEDVIYSLNTMKASPVVNNSSAYNAVTAIEKGDDQTVKVTLSQPSQNLWRGQGSLAGP